MHHSALPVMSSLSRSISPVALGQSDFTHMDDLGITIVGAPFPHLLYHFVLTYSNVEAIHLCFSESFEALAEGTGILPLAARRCPAAASNR